MLKNGLNERAKEPREAVLNQLIPNWIKGLNDDVVKFLEYLDIKKSFELSQQFLTSYFTHLKKSVDENDISPFHQLVFKFQKEHLDELKLFTKCPLTEEYAFFWFSLCEFCQKNNLTYKIETKEGNVFKYISCKQHFKPLKTCRLR